MSKVPKPGCGLESECGTVNFFACIFGAPPISNPKSTHALNPHMLKTLNYASCGLVHQSFTISSSTSSPPPPPPPSVLCTRVQKRTLYQFQLFISAFHFSFSAFFFILFQLPTWGWGWVLMCCIQCGGGAGCSCAAFSVGVGLGAHVLHSV